VHDLLWSWLLPNAAYDLSRQIIVSLVMAIAGAALLGPLTSLVRGALKITAAAIVIFITVFVVSSFVRPQPAVPNLFPVPQAAIVGVPRGAGTSTGNAAGVVMIVEVINRGTLATVARNWSLRAKVDDTTLDGKPERIPESFTMHTLDQGRVVFHDRDALYNKGSAPIAPGGSITGIAAYTFEHVPLDIFLNRKTTFIISFMDAMDHAYSIESPLKPLSDTEINFYPGLTMEVCRP
jgi:hypothetical protein